VADSVVTGEGPAHHPDGMRPDGTDPANGSACQRPDIPDSTIDKWQRIVDLVADIFEVPAGLISRLEPEQVAVVVASAKPGNPYKRGQTIPLDTGLYCEATMSERRPFLVPDARKDPDWKNSPCSKAGMVSYLGHPIVWPDDEIFGTLCVLDDKENAYSATYLALMAELSEIIGGDLRYLVETASFRRAEQDLRKSERLLRAIAETAEDSIFTKDVNRRYTFVNPAMERVLGLPASELLGKTPEEVFDAESAAKIAKVDRTALRGKSVDKIRTLDVAGSAKTFHTIQAPLTGPDGRVEGICGIVRDITERTLADQERRRLYHFRSYFLQSIMGMGLASFQQEWTEANARLCRMLGYEREELVGKHWAELTHPKDRHIDEAQFAALLDGTIDEYEVTKRLIRKDGRTIHVKFAVRCYLHSQVMPDHVVVLVEDITKRRLVTEALARSEEKYRELVENANSIILRMGVEGRVTFFNEFAQEFFGFTEREIIGRNVVGTIVPETESTGRNLAGLVGEVVANPAKYITNENENMRRNGERVWIAWTNRPIRDKQGRISEILCVGNDITERKRAEEALDEKRQALAQAFDGIAMADLNGIIVFVNNAWAAMHGYSPEELVGQHLSVFHSAEQMAEDVTPFNELVLKDGRHSGQVGHVTRDGRVFQTRMSSTVYRDQHGSPKGLIGIARDISEELRLEQQLRHAQRMEAIGVLAGGIAHNLRNTLGSTLGWIEMAADRAGDDNTITSCLGRATKAARRGAEQVRQVLRFARKAEPERRPLALVPVVRDASELLRQAKPSTVTLVLELDEDCGLVLADADEVEQVVLNLGTNALQAMEGQDGVLGVCLQEIEIAPGSTDSPQDLKPGRYAQLVLSDTGAGMERDVLERIFEPFYTTKEPGEGTGLGLSTVHGIVVSHDGAITVTSDVGEGTSFTVLLPIWTGEAPALETPPPPSRKPGGDARKRVLMVDDNQDFAEMTGMGLSGLSFEVVLQTSAVSALDTFFAGQDDFDIVVLDQVMPDMTGLDLARKIRKIRPAIPIVLLSGLTERVDAEEAEAAGISAFLTKPATPRELACVIREMLEPGSADDA
jgi:PAS domain S-box-containing protein